MMNYRGPEMAELMEELTGNLKRFLDTSRDVLLVTASGTGGLEATIANMLSPGDRVLGVNAGVFGRRFCVVAEAFGASLQTIEVDEGRALDPETLKSALHEEKDCRAVLLTHNETSTAVAHPIGDLCRVVREESDALVFVDAVSSLGAMPLPIDALDIDVVISGSQKAWGVPPGMAMLALSKKAWKATELATSPRFYFDLRRYRDAQAREAFRSRRRFPSSTGFRSLSTSCCAKRPRLSSPVTRASPSALARAFSHSDSSYSPIRRTHPLL